jgi:hypothetical protein
MLDNGEVKSLLEQIMMSYSKNFTKKGFCEQTSKQILLPKLGISKVTILAAPSTSIRGTNDNLDLEIRTIRGIKC